ncbi:hypothetical protein [Solimonas sp. SE-A11]|uniref:hypothetical protein n=1 Tax=Solimonas sp. SE-A11 TaxID=3054954 RepID=UPI00259D1691|nr:hypothetical protein [Solimonas sp. SE-A11]MDM4768653.1 hypothetical protein [Solimonas sp. SE-A11]
MSTHKCPISSCTWQVPDDRLMCLKHWEMVPTFKRRQVTVERDAVRKAGTAQTRQAAQLRYVKAQRAAIDSISHLAVLP